MSNRRFLEDIIEDEKYVLISKEKSLMFKKGIFTRSFDFITDHPVLLGVSAFGIYRLFNDELSNIFNYKNNFLDDISLSYINYLSIKALGRLIGKYKIEYNKNISNIILDNKSIFSIGLMSSLFVYQFIKNTYPDDLIASYNSSIVPAIGLSSEIIINGINNSRKFKNFKSTSFKEKLWNFIFEHPILIGSSFALYETISMYNARLNNNTFTGNIIKDFSNEPIWPIISLGFGGIYSSIAFIPSTLGSIFHTSSLKLIKNKALRSYYKFNAYLEKDDNKKLAYYKNAIKYQELLLEIQDSKDSEIENLVELGSLYKKIDEDKAYFYYRKALRSFSRLDNNLSYFEYLKKTLRLNKLFRLTKRFRKKDTDIEAIFIDLLNNDFKALDNLKLLSEENKDPKYQYIYGKGLEILGFYKSGLEQKVNAIKKIISKSDLEEISNSKNKVLLLKSGFFIDEVVAKEGGIKELKQEIDTTRILLKKLKDYPSYEVPVPIAIINGNNKNYYIMEQAEGEDFSELLKNKTATNKNFEDISKFLGVIHSIMNLEDIQNKERNSKKIIYSRFVELGFLDNECKNLVNSLDPLIYSVKKLPYVWNKDAHPGNWRILNYNRIMSLDNEGGRAVPITYDEVNLTLKHNLEDNIKEIVIKEHLSSYNKLKNTKIKIDNNFRIAYLNSIIIRSLEVYPQLIESKDFKTSKIVIKNATKAIKSIKDNHKEYYVKSKQEYETINKTLDSLEYKINNF